MKRLWISAALILSLALLAGCHVLYLGRLTGELVDLFRPEPKNRYYRTTGLRLRPSPSQALKLWQRHEFYLHSTMRHNDIDTVLVAFHEVLAFLRGTGAAACGIRSCQPPIDHPVGAVVGVGTAHSAKSVIGIKNRRPAGRTPIKRFTFLEATCSVLP